MAHAFTGKKDNLEIAIKAHFTVGMGTLELTTDYVRIDIKFLLINSNAITQSSNTEISKTKLSPKMAAVIWEFPK